jgi:hypothetical protein
MLIDPSLNVSRLRAAIEQLFAVSNQAAYLGCIHRSVAPLTLQMGNRLYVCIDDLGRVIKDLEPKKIYTSSLALEDSMTLTGYQELKRGLLLFREFIEAREQAIIRQAGIRIADSGRGQSL